MEQRSTGRGRPVLHNYKSALVGASDEGESDWWTFDSGECGDGDVEAFLDEDETLPQ